MYCLVVLEFWYMFVYFIKSAKHQLINNFRKLVFRYSRSWGKGQSQVNYGQQKYVNILKSVIHTLMSLPEVQHPANDHQLRMVDFGTVRICMKKATENKQAIYLLSSINQTAESNSKICCLVQLAVIKYLRSDCYCVRVVWCLLIDDWRQKLSASQTSVHGIFGGIISNEMLESICYFEIVESG